MGIEGAGRVRAVLRGGLEGALILLALVGFYLWADPVMERRVLEKDQIRPGRGLSYEVPFPDTSRLLVLRSDFFTRNRRSKLLLLEDGRPLGPAHSLHKKIADQGRGGFSHWGSKIIFAASDNSDPRTNGREYTAVYPLQPSEVLLFLLGLNLIRFLVLWYRRYAVRWLERARVLAGAVPFSAKYGALLVLVAASVWFRVGDILLHPVLQVEDGYYFARFYNSGRWEMILLGSAGYIRLLANALYILSTHVPVRWAPYILTWTPAFLAVFLSSLFMARRYRALVPSDWLRFAICLIYVLSPLGQHHFLAHTDYSSWNFLLLVVLLTMGGIPDRWPWLTFGVLNLAVWGTPLALVALPVTILHYFREKGARAKTFYLLTSLNLVLHQVLAIDPAYLVLDMGMAIKWTLLTGHMLVTKVLLPPLLGKLGAQLAAERFVHLGVLIMVGFTYLTARFVFPRYRTWVLYFLYFVPALTLGMLAGRETTYDFLQGLSPASRYFHAQVFLCLVGLVLLAAEVIRAIPQRTPAGAGGSSGADLRPLRVLLWGAVLAYFGLLNTIPQNVAGYRPADPRNGALVEEFFRDLERAEKEAGDRRGISLRLDKYNDWPIVINTRKK